MPRKKKIETTDGMVRADLEETNAQASSDKTLIQEIEEMRANNQVGTSEFTDKMRQLEILLGVSEISPFGTNELDIFEQNLIEMSYSDMQKLAHRIGINPYLEKPILKKSLIREFSHYTKNSRKNILPTPIRSFVPDPNNPEHQKLMKILSDI